MAANNYGKDISSINTPIRFHLPDGSTQQFPNAQEAQNWFDQNYADGYSMTDYIPTQRDSDNPIELKEVTVTAKSPNKPKSINLDGDIDKYIGANYNPRFNAASAKLGMNPLNWTKHIPASYWNSDTHKAINEGNNIAAGVASAPFIAYGAAEYALPWLAKNVAPYLSARGWLSATQAAGNTPAWLTPTSATAIDAALVGSATGASISDMRKNGPTVGNVLGTALGVGGLAYESAPTIMEGYTAVRNAVRPYILAKDIQGVTQLRKFGYGSNKSYTPSIQVTNLHHPHRQYYYWDGTPKADWSNFDKNLLKQDILAGKQDFLDWVNSPAYRKAALNNKIEAESMGLSYTPIWEKPSFIEAQQNFRPVISTDTKHGQGWVFTSDDPGIIHLRATNESTLRPTVKHEMAHSSRLAWADPKLKKSTYKPRQENKYLRFKNSQVFDDGADFTNKSEFYDFTGEGFPHEAVTNTRDLGERLGIKVGQPYPGDSKVLEIINEVRDKYPNTLYGNMAKHFRRDPENLKFVWKALNGTQWLLIPTIFGTPTVIQNKFGGKLNNGRHLL